ncbi:MAG TPA: hypothetical protein VLM38_05035 [Blastocatellia bacterium]|nr:hypothetical protein [Blastocatellia bacterium]
MILALICLIGPPKSFGQHRPAKRRYNSSHDTYRGLHLAAALNPWTYRLRDIATVVVTLENVDRGPITIYGKLGWGCFGSLGFGLEDMRGRGLIAASVPGSFYHPPFATEDFITLLPGQKLKTERDFEIGRDEGITTPGTYQVVIWYNSPVPREFAPLGLDIWPMENGRLLANKIRVIVTK